MLLYDAAVTGSSSSGAITNAAAAASSAAVPVAFDSAPARISVGFAGIAPQSQ
jgi:hypothetical protein